MTLNARELPHLLEEALAAEDDQLRAVRVTDVVRLEGGAIGQAFRFTLERNGEHARFVVRADRPTGFAPQTDRAREWAIVSWVTRHTSIPAPAARWFFSDRGPLGTKAIVTDFVDAQPLMAIPSSQPDADLGPLASKLAEVAAAIHQVDLAGAPTALAMPKSWDDYIDEQLELLARMERDYSEPLPVLRYLGRWLAERRPPPAPLGLLHGDFEAPNCLITNDGSFTVVDWETARVGDPREDLGWFRLMGSSMVPPDLIGRDPDAFCARYRELTGLPEEVVNPTTLDYFSVFGAITNLNIGLSYFAAFERNEARGLFATYMPRILLTLTLPMFRLATRARSVTR